MGCCVGAAALAGAPRVAFVLTWLFTNRVTLAFETFLWPLLGLLFMPWTVLTWTFAYAPVRGVTGIGWILVIIAVFVDLGSYGSGERARRG